MVQSCREEILLMLNMRTTGSDGVQPGGWVAQEAGGANPRQSTEQRPWVLEQQSCAKHTLLGSDAVPSVLLEHTRVDTPQLQATTVLKTHFVHQKDALR